MILIIIVACGESRELLPDRIFDKYPISYKIQHLEKGDILDCCLWVHFTLKSSEFNLLSKKLYEVKLDYNKWTSMLPSKVDWWNPSSFGNNGICLKMDAVDRLGTVELYMNSDSSEFYYVEFLP